MATFTASEINPLKGIHVGPNIVRSRFTGSLTLSEVLLLTRIPNKATVLGWQISGGTSAAGTTGTWKIGVAGTVVDAITGATLTEDSLHAGVSLTASGNARDAGLKLPFKVSLSDDAANQFIWLAAIASVATFTGTHSINFVAHYLIGE